jgi:hypothetical protein
MTKHFQKYLERACLIHVFEWSNNVRNFKRIAYKDNNLS